VSAFAVLPGGPFAAGASLVYIDIIRDEDGTPVPGSLLTSLTLTLLDTFNGAIVNGINGVNILNTGRGTVDDGGNLEVILSPADMSMSETYVPLLQRSMIFTYGVPGGLTGIHRADFLVRNPFAP
jgi:hypothetical protein